MNEHTGARGHLERQPKKYEWDTLAWGLMQTKATKEAVPDWQALIYKSKGKLFKALVLKIFPALGSATHICLNAKEKRLGKLE